jgi:hypothetical protein
VVSSCAQDALKIDAVAIIAKKFFISVVNFLVIARKGNSFVNSEDARGEPPTD